ncbi:MAG: DUF4180 domain-containing protein [Nonomuraea sp.]|nr:DUF4180 domain-containing protein [Nonomuraea sp.]
MPEYFVCEPYGPPLRTEQDAADLVGEAIGHGANAVAIPVERLHQDFFRLRTGVAGAIVGKLAVYRLGVAIVGDVSEHVAASDSFRDWVREADRSTHLRFVADLSDLQRGSQPESGL